MSAMEHPVRKLPRIPGFSYRTPGSYFITICCADRRTIFDPILARGIAQECWDDIPGHYIGVELDEFVAMPNHVHGIIVLTEPGRARQASPLPSLGTVVGGYKSAVTRRVREIDPTIGPVWQRNYYERVIRDEFELARVREYIRNNPLRWSEDPYYVA